MLKLSKQHRLQERKYESGTCVYFYSVRSWMDDLMDKEWYHLNMGRDAVHNLLVHPVCCRVNINYVVMRQWTLSLFPYSQFSSTCTPTYCRGFRVTDNRQLILLVYLDMRCTQVTAQRWKSFESKTFETVAEYLWQLKYYIKSYYI